MEMRSPKHAWFAMSLPLLLLPKPLSTKIYRYHMNMEETEESVNEEISDATEETAKSEN
jgi:hypothetical protein